MAYSFVKRRLLDFFRNDIRPHLETLHAEQIFQNIFSEQCRKYGVGDVFYPVGAAANYSMLYLLTRALTELPVRRIVELGTGQSTILIDRLRAREGVHVAYEQSEFWAQTVAARAPTCQIVHSPLVTKTFDDVSYDGFGALQMVPFDLLLVDGPVGTDHVSRYDCVPLVAGNETSEFMVIFDDACRPGEQETVAALQTVFARKGLDVRVKYLASGTHIQAVFTTPAFRAASYFF